MNVDLRFGGNDFTDRKLFHLLIGNRFITSRLLIETTVRRTPMTKVCSGAYFCVLQRTFDIFIELFHMVSFAAKVHLVVSVYSRGPQTAPPCQWLAPKSEGTGVGV